MPAGWMREGPGTMKPADKRLAYPLLSAKVHRRVQPVWRHWLALRSGGLPRRSALNACAFAACLSDVMLLKVIDGGHDFRYDLYGENLRDMFAVHYRSRTLRTVAFTGFERLLREYAEVATTAEPFYIERRQISERDFMSVNVAKLILPLGDDGRTVNDLLICLVCID